MRPTVRITDFPDCCSLARKIRQPFSRHVLAIRVFSAFVPMMEGIGPRWSGWGPEEPAPREIAMASHGGHGALMHMMRSGEILSVSMPYLAAVDASGEAARHSIAMKAILIDDRFMRDNP
jgi:hypothetical protein